MEVVKSQNLRVLKYILVIFLGSVLLTISSKIKIPFYPVPMTMQTFVVLLMGMAFGWKIGVATVSLYLLEGILGFPVFAGTPEKGIGISYMLAHTGGYLAGFQFAAFFAGYLNFNTNIFKVFIKLVLCVSIIYILGMFWLGMLIGWDKPIFQLGALPFLFAELFKITILTLLAKKIIKLREFI
jgi:biotin transport system substrate-specific component|tara:strand:- start:86 stop:634 length:549 start_codon:yes stop_codon:yes gene_type:complete